MTEKTKQLSDLKVARHSPAEQTLIKVKNHVIGGGQLSCIAGPCAIESSAQISDVAAAVSRLGVSILRGGAFKPRTSPYSFQGLGEKGLQYLHQAASRYQLASVSEVMSAAQIPMLVDYVDILQIGARNMQNYDLLSAVGKQSKPVLLKRGMSATYQEWLLAAEYIANAGNRNIILCERGIRTFEHYTRNTLDIAAVPVLRELSHLPIIVDPSHASGRRALVAPLAKAAVACGADGVMLEVHANPDQALSDGEQSIDFGQLTQLMPQLQALHQAQTIA